MSTVPARVGIEPRRQASRRTRKMLLSRPMLEAAVVLVVMVLVLFVGMQQLLSLTGHGWSPGLFGFLLGSGLTSVGWALWTVTTQRDGSWSWRIGAQAERDTARVLRRLGERWRFQYNVVFYGGTMDAKKWVTDVDCVAVGPGGVLAVSTKWTSDRWDLTDPTDEWLTAAARGAARQAELLAGPLGRAVRRPPMRPLVVCWGPELEPIPGGVTRVTVPRAQFPEVLVVHGAQANEWLPLLAGDALTDGQVVELDGAVAAWIDGYEDRHGRTNEAQGRAAGQLRWSLRLTAASVAVAAAASAWFVAASVSRDVLRALGRFTGLGGGAVAFAYVVLPLALPLGSAVIARRTGERADRARLGHDRRLVLCSVGAAALWVVAVAVSVAAG